MNVIKDLRKQLCLTQKDLAHKSGLSLRTIQRLEAANEEPQGYTLKAISDALDVDISVLQRKFTSQEDDMKADRLSIKLINLSALAFIGIPFGNLILPFFIWRKRNKSKLVDQTGRKIINFQIVWTIVLCLLLCISPFINIDLPLSLPLILLVLLIGVGINLVVIYISAYKIDHEEYDFPNLPVRLL